MNINNVTYIFCSLIGCAICYGIGIWFGGKEPNNNVEFKIENKMGEMSIDLQIIKDVLFTLSQKNEDYNDLYLDKIKFIIHHSDAALSTSCDKVKIIGEDVLVFNKEEKLIGSFKRDLLDRI